MIDATIGKLKDKTAFLEDWRSLYPRAGQTSFFLTPAWMEAWLSDLPSSAQYYRIDVKRDGVPRVLGLVGLQNRRRPRLIGFREARLYETGEPDYDAIYVEYNDFLIDRAAGGEARLAALQLIFKSLRKADVFVFRNVEPGLVRDIEAVARQSRLRAKLLMKQPVYRCDLERAQNHDTTFVNTLSGSLPSKVKRSIRLYRERGDLAYRVVRHKEEWRETWSTFMELHEEGWARRGKKGVFSNAALSAFHERLASSAPEVCSLFEVAVCGKTIGVLYNFTHEGRVLNYQSGFFYEKDNRLLPGFVCHVLAAQHYAEAGYHTYDLLAGEADYKRRLGASTLHLSSLAVERPGLRRWARNAVK